jgi:hypothetical protein
MLPYLPDSLAVVLLAFVGLFTVIDFLLGKSGRKKLQTMLEDWWLKLQYINYSDMGIKEAQFCTRILDCMFGYRLLSLKRIAGSLAFYTISIIACYIFIEWSRFTSGKGLELPFVGPNWDTGFPYQLPSIILSVYTTQALLRIQIKYSRGKFSTIVALFLLPMSFCISPFIFILCGDTVLVTLVMIFQDVLGIGQHPAWEGEPFWYLSVYPFRLEVLSKFFLAHPREAVLDVLLRPTEFSHGTLAQLANYRILVEGYADTYISFVQSVTRLIRLLIFAFFILSWLLVRPGLPLVSLIIYRLSEAERGPLILLAAALAGLTKIIQEAFRRLH